MRIGAALAALLLLAGCAGFGFTEAECRGMDWERRGYADGFGGSPPQDLRLASACGRFGVAVPKAEYFKGWQAGYDEWYRQMGSIDVD
jgi:hypothetical protein